MQEAAKDIWIRPGREQVVQNRFIATLKSLKQERAGVRSDWDRAGNGHSRFTRNALLYPELNKDIKLVESTVADIRDYMAFKRVRGQHVGTNGHVSVHMINGSGGVQSRPDFNPNKRRNFQVKASQEPPATSKLVESAETARVYKLCRLGTDKSVNGSLVIQPMNGWIDKKVAEISKDSPVKAQAVVAMVDYLRGNVSERGANGRAASRHPEKKMPYLSIAIDRRKYSLWTLKPDGIPTVEIKGKELTHVRIVYTTVGDSRVILAVFIDRASYDKYCNTLG